MGDSLIEEVAACMLCGYGVPSETGEAAFLALKREGLLSPGATAEAIEAILREPLEVGVRFVRYRFPRQKARALATCIHQIKPDIERGLDDVGLREELKKLPGIGPKTASFIVRNYRRSENVAVLDIHIVRAGKAMGLFGHDEDPATAYDSMERKFLTFARTIGVHAGILDAMMWDYSREIGWLWTGRVTV